MARTAPPLCHLATDPLDNHSIVCNNNRIIIIIDDDHIRNPTMTSCRNKCPIFRFAIHVCQASPWPLPAAQRQWRIPWEANRLATPSRDSPRPFRDPRVNRSLATRLRRAPPWCRGRHPDSYLPSNPPNPSVTKNHRPWVARKERKDADDDATNEAAGKVVVVPAPRATAGTIPREDRAPPLDLRLDP